MLALSPIPPFQILLRRLSPLFTVAHALAPRSEVIVSRAFYSVLEPPRVWIRNASSQFHPDPGRLISLGGAFCRLGDSELEGPWALSSGSPGHREGHADHFPNTPGHFLRVQICVLSTLHLLPRTQAPTQGRRMTSCG